MTIEVLPLQQARLIRRVYLMLLGMLLSGMAVSQELTGSRDDMLYMDIPAAPLLQSLTRYNELTGLAVLVDSRLTDGRRASTVQGHYSAKAALEQMLRGTDLVVRYSSERAFTLTLATAAQYGQHEDESASLDSSTLGLGGHPHAALLQAALREALCRSSLTRPGQYRAVLQIWQRADGRVERVALLETTGDTSRDEAIITAVQRLQLRTSGRLPQPLVVLLSKQDNGQSECPAAS